MGISNAIPVPGIPRNEGCRVQRRTRMNKRNSALAGLVALLIAASSLLFQALPVAARQRGRGAAAPAGPIRRLPDGKPDLTGFYSANAGGANYGLEQNPRDGLTPQTTGIVVDPPDKKLPYQPWARAERIERELPERGYDDPTAHCFVAGVPRSMYTPSPYQILQPPGYVVMLFERMSWRQVPLDGRAHLPDNIRLWQGDSVGHWEGDTLVIDTTNMNGKTWLNERGDVQRLLQPSDTQRRLRPVRQDSQALTGDQSSVAHR